MKNSFLVSLIVACLLSPISSFAARPVEAPRLPDQQSACYVITTRPYMSFYYCLFGMTSENRQIYATGKGIGVAIVDIAWRKVDFCKRTSWMDYKEEYMELHFKLESDTMLIRPAQTFRDRTGTVEMGTVTFRGRELEYVKPSLSEQPELEAWLLQQPECEQ